MRQLTIVADEDLALIARGMGLPAVDPAWIGAQVALGGLQDPTHLPASSRLQAPAGTTLVADVRTRLCQLRAREIERERPRHGKAFKGAAEGAAAVTA